MEETRFNAWQMGQFNYLAFMTAFGNMVSGKDKKVDYPSYEEVKGETKKSQTFTDQEARNIMCDCY